MADKQPPNNQAIRKLPITPLPTAAYMTNISKQKTNGEKQPKIKEVDRAALEGLLRRAGGLGLAGLEVVLVQIFKLSPLSSQPYRLQL